VEIAKCDRNGGLGQNGNGDQTEHGMIPGHGDAAAR